MQTTVLPSERRELLDATESLLRGAATVELAAGDARVVLPEEVRNLLAEVVTAMRRGQAISVAPVGQQLTTQQAAELLGVSRPTLVKLLEDGKIPFEQPGRHRRVRLSDLLAYQATRRADQRQALREMARDAQDLGLYEPSPQDVAAALSEARHKHA